jgi:filamentous hemagglutinin family protein
LQQLHHLVVGICDVSSLSKARTHDLGGGENFLQGIRWQRQGWTLGIALSLGISGALISRSDRAFAQITGDNTLGAENTQVQSLGSGAFQIDGGATRETNLFHSFSQFSVPTNGLAFFNNAPTIQNIIGRIIGPASIIDGTLQANGTANLFLINPNGISFGQNAQLNLGGSFFASTASSIIFADGTQFSTTTPQSAPLLTVSVPLGLQYGSNPGSIQVQGSILKVDTSQTLALVGGNLSIDGGRLEAPGGRVELGGLAQNGTVGLNIDSSGGNPPTLSFPDRDTVARADVSLINGAVVDLVAGGGGDIAINARNITISGSSAICGGVGQDGSSCSSQGLGTGVDDTQAGFAGYVFLDAKEAVSISDSLIESTVNFGSDGGSGGIFIDAGSVSISGSRVDTSNYSSGTPGSISILARDQVAIDNSLIANQSQNDLKEVYAGIQIEATQGSVLLNESKLSASNFGSGWSGDVVIGARDTISILNGSNISSNGLEGRIWIGKSDAYPDLVSPKVVKIDASRLETINDLAGRAGNISIDGSEQISITNNSQILSDANQEANAGSVFLRTDGSVSIENSLIGSSVLQEDSTGNAGQILIEAGSVSLSGAQVDTDNFGSGVAGNITISAGDQDLIATNSNISSTSRNAITDPDNIPFIQLEATKGSISLNQSRVSTSNSGSDAGSGWAGDIAINARDQVSILNGSKLFSEGNYGRILIGESTYFSDSPKTVKIDNSTLSTNNQVRDQDGKLIQASRAGDIRIVSSDSIVFSNQAKIRSDTTGEGGNIYLSSPLILLRGSGKLPEDTLISTNATGLNSPGGDITIDTTNLVAVPKENSDITANSKDSRGGNVTVNASGGIFGLKFRTQLTPRSDITATGLENGTVTLNTPVVDPAQGLEELPVTVTDPSNQIVTGCAAARGNSFTVTGRGGLPEDPTATIRGQTVWRDFQDYSQGTGVGQVSPQKPQALMRKPSPRLMEANSWVFDEKGNVVLVAVEGNGTPSTYKSRQPNCQDLSSLAAPKN